MNTEIKLTVYFQDPFWVGVFEKSEGDKLSVARVVFGSEPKDYEVYEYILRNYNALKFSISLQVEKEIARVINPKRLQRKLKKEIQEKGIGTKAQEVMKLQYETQKEERRHRRKEYRKEIEEEKFIKKQEKKKQKKKGH
ncbi:YjdF family protein [Clostridium sp. 'White wine YQ']|uniref:YjdF family protein n=1 Tax=Clostridium sp. 'White wine YQ' TaxID=3027474 RepID=UPI002366B8E0|nr:YjdF family protein [Clostridium sp. 'White wine YQ']MDD7794811.1 YjdF family protein [Clostridium sp. 'White wine YQ']